MPDIARDPAILKRKKLRHALYAAAGALLIVVVSIALARMEPAAPTVERATVLTDTVKRGSIIRQHRGLGTLVPEDTRWLPSRTNGRVERIVLRPGAQVAADSVILELSNPDVEQEALNARLALHSAEAALENLRVQLENDLLTQESQTAAIQAEYETARMQAEADAILRDTLLCFEHGAIEQGTLTAFNIAIEQFHNAVADRKALLLSMPQNLQRASAQFRAAGSA